jgi:transaldolase
MDYFKRVGALTPTRFWVNNVTLAQAQLGVEAGAVGCTQNPAYISKVINKQDDGPYVKELMDKYLRQESDDDAAIAALQVELVKNISQYFLPMFQKSHGEIGWVSIQANPFREDLDTVLSNAYSARAAAENIIIKIPATKDCFPAIEALIRERIPVLATEVMSMDQVIRLHETVDRALVKTSNPAAIYLAHINGIFDEQLSSTVKSEAIDINPDILWHGSFALAQKIRKYMVVHQSPIGYLAGGARGLHHFTQWVGVQGAVTINWLGTADKLIEQDLPVVDHFSAGISYEIIDELIEKLPDFRKAYIPGSLTDADFEEFGPVVRFRNSFQKGWQAVRDYAAERRKSL